MLGKQERYLNNFRITNDLCFNVCDFKNVKNNPPKIEKNAVYIYKYK